MDRRKTVGRIGENLAIEYLEGLGYKLLERNVRIGQKEIDVIVQKNKKILFVEVKTKTSFVFGGAETALSSKQLSTLKRAINYYCEQNHLDPENVRLDFIAIDIDEQKNTVNLQHFEEIY